MKSNIVILTGLLWCIGANAEITPAVKIPEGFDETRYSVKTIEEGSHIHYIQQTDECNDIKYKDFYSLKPNIDILGRNTPENAPISEWFCLFSIDVYKNGYDTGGYPEKVFFNKKRKIWELKKTGVKSTTEKSYIPLMVYNIKSLNTKGFAVIDKNISTDDKNFYHDKNLKIKIYFCLIHKDGLALCGTGNLNTIKDGKEVDLIPYAMKSLESMEMRIKAPRVNNEK